MPDFFSVFCMALFRKKPDPKIALICPDLKNLYRTMAWLQNQVRAAFQSKHSKFKGNFHFNYRTELSLIISSA